METEKTAKIRMIVAVPIVDDVELPDGRKRYAMKLHTNYVNTVADLLRESKGDRFDRLLASYVDLRILEMVGVPFQPLTTEAAMKIKDCEIEEQDSNMEVWARGNERTQVSKFAEDHELMALEGQGWTRLDKACTCDAEVIDEARDFTRGLIGDYLSDYNEGKMDNEKFILGLMEDFLALAGNHFEIRVVRKGDK